ncbi:L,D-transpeptidase [Tsukamurella soli]
MIQGRLMSRRLAALVAIVATGASLGACTIGSKDALPLPAAGAAITDSTPFTDLLRPQVTSSVHNGSTSVQPGVPIQVSVTGGALTTVTLKNADGETVAGRASADGRSWQSTEPLGYTKQYTLHVEADGIGGVNIANQRFTTESPTDLTQAYFTTPNNTVVGVGQTVGIQFDEPIPDRLAAQKAITVTTNPQVDGAFYWISPTEVRWRPENYFTPGTKVDVSVNTYGVDLGGGLMGQQNVTDHFTIGDELIAKVSDKDKIIRVYRSGKLIKTMPTSMGEPANPTPSGIYMLGDHDPSIIMDSSTFGVPANSPGGYRTLVYDATQMAYNGIYVHSAPWSLDEQGNTDVSHGCLNVSPDNALWFLNNTKRGDLVIVSDTIGPKMDGADGLGDWNIPWAVWKAGNAKQS